MLSAPPIPPLPAASAGSLSFHTRPLPGEGWGGCGEDMTHQSPSPSLSLVPFFIHDIDWPFQMVTRVFFALLRFQVTLNEMTQVRRITSTAEWRVMLAGGHGGCWQSQRVLEQECTKVQAAGPLYGGVMSPLCQKYRQTRLCLSTVLEVT